MQIVREEKARKNGSVSQCKRLQMDGVCMQVRGVGKGNRFKRTGGEETASVLNGGSCVDQTAASSRAPIVLFLSRESERTSPDGWRYRYMVYMYKMAQTHSSFNDTEKETNDWAPRHVDGMMVPRWWWLRRRLPTTRRWWTRTRTC